MPYSWRRLTQDRWLCIDDDHKLIVGTIFRESAQRHRIQLRSSDGVLLLHPVIFNRFGTARQILLSKLESSASKDPATDSDDETRAIMVARQRDC